jgi:NADH-quinone oxidoreductase subunit M
VEWPILSIIIFLPLFGAFLIALLPERMKGLLKGISLLFMLVTLAIVLYVFHLFGGSDTLFIERIPWIQTFGIDYYIGVDALNILMLLMTGLLFPIALISGWERIKERAKLYLALMLGLECALMGAYVALDIFLFYIFYEAMLIPMYFIIGLFGGKRRVYATTRFVIYTIVGSLLMLVAILFVFFTFQKTYGYYTGDIYELRNVAYLPGIGLFLFFAFTVAFGIKAPLWPLHSWMPDAYVEIPYSGNVLLAGLMSKVGIYGFLRFALPLFPDMSAAYAPIVMALASVAVIYGAMVATVQKELKRLIAFFSFSHIGMILIGLFSMTVEGVEGAVLQMANHAVLISALFILVGIINDRRETTEIHQFGGIGRVTPVMATIFMISTLASIGVPGFNGFIGEALIIIGTFKYKIIFGILVASGALLGTICMLWMYERVFFGTVTKKVNEKIPDL